MFTNEEKGWEDCRDEQGPGSALCFPEKVLSHRRTHPAWHGACTLAILPSLLPLLASTSPAPIPPCPPRVQVLIFSGTFPKHPVRSLFLPCLSPQIHHCDYVLTDKCYFTVSCTRFSSLQRDLVLCLPQPWYKVIAVLRDCMHTSEYSPGIMVQLEELHCQLSIDPYNCRWENHLSV